MAREESEARYDCSEIRDDGGESRGKGFAFEEERLWSQLPTLVSVALSGLPRKTSHFPHRHCTLCTDATTGTPFRVSLARSKSSIAQALILDVYCGRHKTLVGYTLSETHKGQYENTIRSL